MCRSSTVGNKEHIAKRDAMNSNTLMSTSRDFPSTPANEASNGNENEFHPRVGEKYHMPWS
jgi:hypothetical protein